MRGSRILCQSWSDYLNAQFNEGERIVKHGAKRENENQNNMLFPPAHNTNLKPFPVLLCHHCLFVLTQLQFRNKLYFGVNFLLIKG